MINQRNQPVALATSFSTGLATAVACLALVLSCTSASAYSSYKNSSGTGNCSTCHGAFTDDTSPKGTKFPSNDKHEMHRASTSMGTACNLCHTSGDGRNPYMSTSTGTTANPGLGCTGCHEAAGLRLHHAANGVDICWNCHDSAETAPPEGTKPPYYGTVDTKANNPCNLVRAANTNENWSVGDFLGLDNDGNNLYDAADSACGSIPATVAKVMSAMREGNNVRVTWQTAGGQTDLLQAAGSVTGTYTNVSPGLVINGAGTVTTNYVDPGAATNTMRYYRVTSQR